MGSRFLSSGSHIPYILLKLLHPTFLTKVPVVQKDETNTQLLPFCAAWRLLAHTPKCYPKTTACCCEEKAWPEGECKDELWAHFCFGWSKSPTELSQAQSSPYWPAREEKKQEEERENERGCFLSSISPYKEKNTCEVLITSKTTAASNPSYEPPPTFLTTPTGSVLGFHLSRSLDLHWTRIPCHLILSARLPPCALGTCLKNSIFGSALKDCISPEGQLLADSSAKKHSLLSALLCFFMPLLILWLRTKRKSQWGLVWLLVGQDPGICSPQECLADQWATEVSKEQ